MSFFGIPMRNGLSLGLGTVASLTNGPGFLPDELFYGGTVQGAWYDPSDLTTLFQDSAGTTPVTAVEQAVGLMLDKSKGLVLGPELMTNGDFSQGTTGWTAEAGWTISGGAASYSSPSTSGFSNLYQIQPVVAGQLYRFSLTVTNRSAAGRIAVRFGGSTFSPDITANGQFVCYLFAPSTGNLIVGLQHISGGSAGTVTITVDDFSVRELPGNHAYQSINTSRPTLRARYNLLTRSEEFDNAAWTKSATTAISANSAVAPDGSSTADKLQETTATSVQYFCNQTLSFATGTYTATFYAKAQERNWVYFEIGNSFANIDLSNGATGATGQFSTGWTFGSASATAVGNGWYRCTITSTCTAAATYIGLKINIASANNTIVYNGTAGNGLFIWGAQLVPTAVFPSNTYQRIGAATDYATGAAFPPYLFFDGIDDSMLTNSVDFSATDKMLVVAGVTKNSDATAGIVVENFDTTPGGVISLSASPSATAAYFFRSAGTADSSGATPTNYAAPISNVLTGIGEISTDTRKVRVNGVEVVNSATDQGTGNYANRPITIGFRSGGSLFLNGNIYSLIIAGQSYSSGQISSTESWVAAKTPLGTI